MSLIGIASLATGVGCDEEPRAAREAPSEREAPAVDATCRARIDRLRAAEPASTAAHLFGQLDEAPSVAGGEELDLAPLLIVTPERVELDGPIDAPDATAAGRRAAEKLGALRTLGRYRPDQGILLYSTRRAALDRVRAVTTQLPPDTRIHLVVQDADAAAPEPIPPPPPWLAEALADVEATDEWAERQGRIRSILRRASGACDGVEELAPMYDRRPEQGPPPNLADARSRSLPALLEACACDGLDVDAMMALGAWSGPANRRPLRQLSFTLTAGPGEGVEVVPSDGSVERFAELLAARPAPRRIFFGPPRAQ